MPFVKAADGTMRPTGNMPFSAFASNDELHMNGWGRKNVGTYRITQKMVPMPAE